MNSAAQASKPQDEGFSLLDPLDGCALAMRVGPVERACIISRRQLADDTYFIAKMKEMREHVLASSLTPPKET